MAVPSSLRLARVDLWIVPISEPTPGAPFPPESLSEEELHRANRFRKRGDYLQFVCTRHALRTLLGRHLGARAQDVRFRLGAHGKPAIEETSTVEFSVSHSAGLGLIGLSDRCAVGVDVERLPDRPERTEAIRSMLSDTERLLESDAPPTSKNLLMTWALKEAILKADGRGLSASPRDITVLTKVDDLLATGSGTCTALSRVWALRALEPRPGYVGALAADADAIALEIHEWD